MVHHRPFVLGDPKSCVHRQLVHDGGGLRDLSRREERLFGDGLQALPDGGRERFFDVVGALLQTLLELTQVQLLESLQRLVLSFFLSDEHNCLSDQLDAHGGFFDCFQPGEVVLLDRIHTCQRLSEDVLLQDSFVLLGQAR